MNICFSLQARTDADVLLLPILELLYATEFRCMNQAYLLVIILLILSEDSVYVVSTNQVIIKEVKFYKEKQLKQTQLSSLVFMVLLRLAQVNTFSLKDVYLHTNTLATLANLAPSVTHLNIHSCQKLVSLLGTLDQRLEKLNDSASMEKVIKGEEVQYQSIAPQLYSDFLNIILEVLNAIVVHNLSSNTVLLYCLLHQRDTIERVGQKEQYADLMQNLIIVIEYFGNKVEQSIEKNGHSTISIESIQDLIASTIGELQKDWLKSSADLKFTYEEESSNAEFFLPYIWDIISSSPLINLIDW